MFFRVMMITILLGANLVFGFAGDDPILAPEQVVLMWLIVGTYGLTIIYALLLKKLEGRLERLFAIAQLLIDLTTSAAIISLTGWMDSPFLFLLSLTTLNAAILLYLRGALYIATPAIAFLAVLSYFESMRPGDPALEDLRLRGLFIAGFTNMIAIFLVAILAGYLSDRLRYAREDLEAVVALHEHVIASISSGMIGFSLDYRILLFNPSASKIMGISPPINLDVRQFFQEVDGISVEAYTPQWEVEFTRPNGARRILSLSLSPIMRDLQIHTGWTLIFQDLTQIRQMEKEMWRREQLAAVGEMATGLAHELGNPLASISGSVQMLKTRVNGAMEERLMGIILREIKRLDKLLDNFRRFAKPSAPELKPVNLNRMIENILEIFQYLDRDQSKEMMLIKEFDDEIQIEGDASKLKQVFWNLLTNAYEACGPKVEITFRLSESDGWARVEISDNGEGISEEISKQILNPFFTTKDKGTGLGLPLVMRIVHDHNGTLDIESTQGQGSTFIVTLPRARRVEAA